MIKKYFLLARPKTLPLSVIPVSVSLAYAYFRGFNPDPFLIACVFACPILLQIAANAYNDAKDFEKGADSQERLGPKRMASEGELSLTQIKNFTKICIGLALMAGLYTVFARGIVPLLLGTACIWAALGYTGGKRPVAYSPFGEAYVILFFGLVAVCGSYFVLTGTNDFSFYPVGASLGILGANVLLVNNYRDLETDRKAGRKTLCVLIGRKKALVLYKVFGIVAQFLTLWSLQRHFEYPFFFVPFLSLPWFMKTVKSLEASPIDRSLNGILAQSVLLQALHGILIILAYVGDYAFRSSAF